MPAIPRSNSLPNARTNKTQIKRSDSFRNSRPTQELNSMKLTRLFTAFAIVCLTVSSAFAQNTFKAAFEAVDYGKWQMVIFSSAASGAQTVQVSYPGSQSTSLGPQTDCIFTAVNGRNFRPFQVGTPVTISDSNQETVTPTAVVNSATGCSFTATLSNAHAAGTLVSSGTFGLQEAIQDAFTMGG